MKDILEAPPYEMKLNICLFQFNTVVKLTYNPLKYFSYKFTIIEGNKVADYV